MPTARTRTGCPRKFPAIRCSRPMPERLHKFLARCGVGSRRQCEQWMQEGRVTVDGVEAREPGTVIDPDAVEVCFNGRVVRPQMFRYLALNKPPGFVCTSHDPQGRPCAVELVPTDFGRLYTVGRLDTNSEGLILITNDGDFAHRLMHPRHEVHKVYELWLHEPLSPEEILHWRQGIEDDGERLRVLSLFTMKADRSGFGYRVVLGEGRNRHLRRMAAACEKKVLRLCRVAIGSLQLGALKRGTWRDLTPDEVARLRAPKT